MYIRQYGLCAHTAHIRGRQFVKKLRWLKLGNEIYVKT